VLIPSPRGPVAPLLLLVLATLIGTAVPPRAVVAEPAIELITYGPGDQMFARWGHVALRVIDPALGRDVVYSFGYAPVEEPSFLLEYLRGSADYLLVVRDWERELERYRLMDRTVERQVLNLTRDQASDVAGRLAVNALSENRAYRYDHVFDNCSTRVRDLLDEVTAGALRDASELDARSTRLREHTLEAGAGRLDAVVALDLIGGPHQETEIDGWVRLHLPLYLQQTVSRATVERDGRPIALAGPAERVYERVGEPPREGSLTQGRKVVVAFGVIASLIFVLIATFGRMQRVGGLVLLVVGLLFGLTGLALDAMVLMSDVHDFAWNENVLLFVPLDLVWVGVGASWMRSGTAGIGPRVRLYAVARLLAVIGLVAFKITGGAPQDNWAFLVASAAVLVGLLTIKERTQGEHAK